MEYTSTAINSVTGDLIKTRASTELFGSNLEVIQENNRLIADKTCESCIDFVSEDERCKQFNRPRKGDERRCSFYEEKK